MNLLAEQIIVDILAREMTLDSGRVFIRDQNLKLPPDDGLYVVVGMVGEQPFGIVNSIEATEITGVNRITVPGSNRFTDSGDQRITAVTGQGLKQVQQIVTQEQIQIDIMSRSREAIQRRWEIFAALASIYSVQQQELNTFKIFKIPSSFANTSGTEGGSNLNKFSITVTCHVWYRKESYLQSGDYYDDFTQRVDDDTTIGNTNGLFDFEITNNQIIH